MFCFNFIACSYWRKLFTLYFVPHTIPITCDGHDRMNSEQDFFEHSFFEKILLITFYAYKFVNCIPLLLPTTIILRLFYQTFTLLTPCVIKIHNNTRDNNDTQKFTIINTSPNCNKRINGPFKSTKNESAFIF